MTTFALNPRSGVEFLSGARRIRLLIESRGGSEREQSARAAAGYKTSAGTAQAGSLKRLLSEDDAVRWAGRDRRSIACSAILRRSQKAHRRGSVGDAAERASGTAQTRKITVIAAPSAAVLDVTSTAAQQRRASGRCGSAASGSMSDRTGRHLRDNRGQHGLRRLSRDRMNYHALLASQARRSRSRRVTRRCRLRICPMSAFSTEGNGDCGKLRNPDVCVGAATGGQDLYRWPCHADGSNGNRQHRHRQRDQCGADCGDQQTSAFSVRAAQPRSSGGDAGDER